jgi:hypothetical protein
MFSYWVRNCFHYKLYRDKRLSVAVNGLTIPGEITIPQEKSPQADLKGSETHFLEALP